MQKHYLILPALLSLALLSCGSCKGPAPQDAPTPQEQAGELAPLSLSVPVTNDWVWSGKPQITIHATNPNNVAMTAAVVVRISTDKKESVTTIELTEEVPAKGEKDILATTKDNLEPGIYRAVCFVNEKNARSFNFAIDPFDIVSAPDKQPDFDAFWHTAKEQLAAIDMDAKLTEITSHSSESRKVYLVELYSVPDGLTGEPVKIRGYYCEPQDGAKHPVIMHFYGYDTAGSTSKCECPYGGSSQYAEFYLSHRGQYLNNRPASTGNPGVEEDCVAQGFH